MKHTSELPHAVDAWVGKDRAFMLQLTDDRVVSVRPESSKLLSRATRAQLAHFQMLNNGEGFLWPDLNEALSVRGFMQQSATEPNMVQVSPGRRRGSRGSRSAAYR